MPFETLTNGADLNLRVSSKRGLDLLLDIRRLNRRLDGYGFGCADDAQQFPDDVLQGFLLMVRVYGAAEVYPSFFHGHLNFFVRNSQSALR